MNGEPSLHVVRKADLRSEAVYATWDDPQHRAPLAPNKRRALLENPLSRSEDDPVQIIGLLGRRVIGRIDLIAGEIEHETTKVPVLWGSLLFVDPAHRHTGMGLMIMLKMQGLHPTIVVCGISQMIHPLYEKLRWTEFLMPRYILLRRSRSVLERYVRSSLLARVLAPVVNLGLAAHTGLVFRQAQGKARGLRVECVPAMSDQYNDLLARHAEPIAPHRSAAWVNWLLQNRLAADDPRNRQLAYLVFNAAGKPVGYFLAKTRFYDVVTQRAFKNLTLGSIQDWAVWDAEALDAVTLALLAARELARTGVDGVEVCTPDLHMGSRLKRLGFMPAGALSLLFKAGPRSPFFNKQLHQQALWKIRPAEGDNFLA